MSVSVTESDSEVQITVVDDGVGIREDELARVRESLDCHDVLSNTDHIGLVNVSERLLLYFGDRASLSIDSKAALGSGGETTVRVHIPHGEASDA